MYAFLLLLSLSLIFPLFSYQLANDGQKNAAQMNGNQVLNRNTSMSYSRIQEAIDAPETLDGHEIFVASGTYYEHVTINKSLSLVGQDPSTTIIDGNGTGKVVYVTADNSEVSHFTLRNGTFGLWIDHAQNSKIIGNILQYGSYGIRLYYSNNSEVTGNYVLGYTFFGFELKYSGNATLRNNSLADNKYNFGVDGNSLWDFMNDVDVSNTVNGKPIRYLINQHDVTIDSFTPFQEIGYLGLVNSTNIRVQNLDVQNNIQGILFAFTTNSIINNVNAKNNWNGIYVAHSQNTSLNGNNANNNFDYGIKFFNSSRSLAKKNNVDNNGWAGIGVVKSPNSTIDGNEANLGIYNLHFVYTNNSVITGNNAARSKPGGYSIAIYYSHNNLIYHNAFANSHIYIESRNWTQFTPRNNWDNGLEGNYWNSYSGLDKNQDGIGDTSYIVDKNNIDNHPLMGKFSDNIVTLNGKTYSITIISNSTTSQFQFNPQDGKVSFIAAGFNGTMGFSRIAVPNMLLQDLHDGNLTFLINGEQPLLQRKWTDEMHAYWYFSYVNIVSESTSSPWLTVALASAPVLIILFLLVFVVYKKKRVRMHRASTRKQKQ